MMRKLPIFVGAMILLLFLSWVLILWPRDALRSMASRIALQNATSFRVTTSGPPMPTPATLRKSGSYWQRKTILRDVSVAEVEHLLAKTYSPIRGWTWTSQDGGRAAYGEAGSVYVFAGNYQNQRSVSVLETFLQSDFDLWRARHGF